MLSIADFLHAKIPCRNGAVPVVLPDMRMPQVLVELTSKRCVDPDLRFLLPPLPCSLLFNLVRCRSDFRMQLWLRAGGGG